MEKHFSKACIRNKDIFKPLHRGTKLRSHTTKSSEKVTEQRLRLQSNISEN